MVRRSAKHIFFANLMTTLFLSTTHNVSCVTSGSPTPVQTLQNRSLMTHPLNALYVDLQHISLRGQSNDTAKHRIAFCAPDHAVKLTLEHESPERGSGSRLVVWPDRTKSNTLSIRRNMQLHFFCTALHSIESPSCHTISPTERRAV
jgi:hypothetical protein